MLNAAMLLNPIYLVTAAIVALGVVMIATSGDIKNSRKETDKFIGSLKELDRQASLNAINSKIREEKDEKKKKDKKKHIKREKKKGKKEAKDKKKRTRQKRRKQINL